MLGIPRKIQAKRFETGTTEDVLWWYIPLQGIFEKKPCEDAEAKVGMVELLLGGQGKKDFMRFKKAVTKGLVASDSTTSIAAPRGITEYSFKLMFIFRPSDDQHQLPTI